MSANSNNAQASVKKKSQMLDVWKRLCRNKTAVLGLVIFMLLVLTAIFSPILFNYEQQIIKTDYSSTLLAPCAAHPFGTDELGRDILFRVMYASTVSLSIGIVTVVVSLFFGLILGSAAGYFGGKVDMIMQRIVEILNSIPYLITVTLLLLVMKPGLMSITFALMFSGWLGMSRIARAEVLKLKEQEYVLASRTLGAKSFRIIFKEILPNIFGPLITQTMFSIPHAIFTEAFLAFIGLGVPEPMASLGSLISSGYQNFTSHPYMIVFPLIVMGLLMLCFNMLADGLRDALDPKMKDM